MTFGKKIGGYGLLAIAVMVIATTVVAALVWSMVSTSPKNPQEITLAITGDEWSEAEFYVIGTGYDVTITASFFLAPDSATDFGLIVEAQETGTAALELGDFNVAISLDGNPLTVGENPTHPGQWGDGKIFVAAGTTTANIVVTITPNAGASDLRGVSFDISAIQT